MKTKRFFAGLVCATLFSTTLSAQEAVDADTVLATVNGTEITIGHVIALADKLPEQYRSAPDKALYDGILDQLIQQTSLGATVDVTQRKVALAIENEKRALLASEALDSVAADAANSEKIAEIYEAEFANAPKTKEFKASHILVETEEEADALVVALAAGADFAETAKEKSTGPSGASGGDLGWFSPERMVPEFSDVVKTLEIGTVSSPVQTQFGWHVIKLFETREVDAISKEQAEAEIEERLRSEAVQAAIATTLDNAEITRFEIEVDPAIVRNTELLE